MFHEIIVFVTIHITFVSSLNACNKLEDRVRKPDINSFLSESINSDNSRSQESLRGADYAIDPHKARRLAVAEQHIVNAFKNDIIPNHLTSPYDDDEEDDCPCLQGVLKYVNEYDWDTRAVKIRMKDEDSGLDKVSKRGKIVTENPILLLRLIRRMVALFSDTMSHCSENDYDVVVTETVEDTFSLEQLVPPNKQDVEDALMGLLRIQYVYGFNASSELRLGIFNGVSTKALLDSNDCLELAEKAMDMDADAMAYQWLVSVQQSYPLEELPEPEEEEIIRRLENGWMKLMNLTQTDNLKQLHQNLAGKQQQRWGSLQSFKSYEPCRGEPSLNKGQKTSICLYLNSLWGPYFVINPVKLEVLSHDPLILQFYDFVGDTAIQTIKTLVESKLVRGGYVNYGDLITNHYRTSMNTWLFDSEEHSSHPVLTKLNRGIEELLQMHVVKEDSSIMQIALYGSLGGHYGFHHDAIMERTPKKFQRHHEGNRIATFLMFLTDVRMGGYTAFLKARVSAKPIKGSAVLWFNTLRSGDIEHRTYHGGCPVVLGQKQVANQWIMQYENMFKWPCSLNQYE